MNFIDDDIKEFEHDETNRENKFLRKYYLVDIEE
jgi:hypothetical protein